MKKAKSSKQAPGGNKSAMPIGPANLKSAPSSNLSGGSSNKRGKGYK